MKPDERTVMVLTFSKVDAAVMKMAVPIMSHTWIRYTRFTPQLLSRLLMVPYLAGQLSYLYLAGFFKDGGDWPWLIILLPLALVMATMIERWSRRLEPLNSIEISMDTLWHASAVGRTRPFIVGVNIGVIFGLFFNMGLATIGLVEANVCLLLAWCYLTCGRPVLPKKKERKPFHIRLPRLSPVGV